MMTLPKKSYAYMGAIIGALAIPHVLITTPSLSESQKKFNIMESDMEEIHRNGGTIVSRKEVNKYGVADITIGLFAGSLTSTVREKNAKKMTELGWTQIGELKNRYCKDGMLYSSYFSDEKFDNSKVVIMNFRYTSETIEICKKALKQATPPNGTHVTRSATTLD